MLVVFSETEGEVVTDQGSPAKIQLVVSVESLSLLLNSIETYFLCLP